MVLTLLYHGAPVIPFELPSLVFFQLNNKAIEKHLISKEKVPFTVKASAYLRV